MNRALFLIVALATATVNAQSGRRLDIIDPNVSTEKELLALPHVTPTVVKTILDGRPFVDMTALDALLAKSLTRPQLTELYRRMFIQIDLNTASKPEILLIPGMGQRILHEFEEYRPYKAMAQFRREDRKSVV